MDLPITIITVVSNSFLGLLTYLKRPGSATNRLFFLLSLILSMWAITNYFSLHSSNPQVTLFWIRVILAIATPMWTTLILLALVFPNDKLLLKKKFLIPLLIYTLVTSIVALSPYMFTGISVNGNNVSPIPGLGIILHALLAIGSLLFSSIILIKKSRKAVGREKLQFKFFLFGIISTFSLLVTTNFIIVNLFKTSAFVVFGPFFTFILVGSISYAIIKHRFLDIGLLVTRAATFAILTAIFAFIYALAFSVPLLFFSSKMTRGQAVMISTVLAVFMAFTFQPLRRILEKISDKAFHKGGYDSSKLLAQLGSIMSINIELKPLTTQIIKALIDQVKITKGAFIILGEEATSIYDLIEVGFERKLFLTFNQITPFLSFSKTIIFDELEENHLKELMRNLDISAAKTLTVKGQPIGLLLLGGKASGEIYSDQDLRILDILAPEVAIAIQNAQSFDKIKKFNVILSDEVKKATSQLQSANNRLKELDHLKDDFVSIASHELRTPMTAIRSYAWMALHKADIPLSKNLEKYLIRVLISTERLINLVNDMLNVSRIESGKIEINPESVDVLSLAKDIVDELYFSHAQEKKIQFIVLEKHVPKVIADPEKLRQVFLNLVGNAMKFTPDGGKIIFDFFTDGKVVEASVKDTGVGMSKEDISKLFHKFGRLDNSYTAAATSGGTGLGLFISKNLIELMHGKVWASSDGLGKGSSFTVSLPIATEETLKTIDQYRVRATGGEAKALEPAVI